MWSNMRCLSHIFYSTNHMYSHMVQCNVKVCDQIWDVSYIYFTQQTICIHIWYKEKLLNDSRLHRFSYDYMYKIIQIHHEELTHILGTITTMNRHILVTFTKVKNHVISVYQILYAPIIRQSIQQIRGFIKHSDLPELTKYTTHILQYHFVLNRNKWTDWVLEHTKKTTFINH